MPPPPSPERIKSSCVGRKSSGDDGKGKGRGKKGKGMEGGGKGKAREEIKLKKWEGREGNQISGNF